MRQGSSAVSSPLSSLSQISSTVYAPLVTNAIYQLTYGKKGVADSWKAWQQKKPEPGTNLGVLDYEWFYDWKFSYLPERNSDPRYVRMFYCRNPEGFWELDIHDVKRYVDEIARSDYEQGFRGRVWLIYNEPDYWWKQCNFPDASAAADYFSDAYDLIKSNDPSAKVFAAGLLWLNTQETRAWWTTFVTRLSNTGRLYKLEGVHVHLYPWHSTAPTQVAQKVDDCATPYCLLELAQVANAWYQTMHVGLGLGDRPIWITETGILGMNNCTTEQYETLRDGFMQPWSQWFAGDSNWPYTSQVDTNPGYDAIAWYATRSVYDFDCSYLLDAVGSAGQPTPIGVFWNAYHPQ